MHHACTLLYCLRVFRIVYLQVFTAPHWTRLLRPNARPELLLEAVACRPLILLEASPSAYPRGLLALETAMDERGGALLGGGSCQALCIVSLIGWGPCPAPISQTAWLRPGRGAL